jgi:UDP-glucose 4-epimerase
MNILVTGAAGYIGSHAVQRLLRDGHEVTALDNLSRGHRQAIDLLMPGAAGRLEFVRDDVGDRAAVERILRKRRIEGIMHFAALAYVGESVENPLRYYRNNTAGALSLLEAAAGAGVRRLVFSSTCATYGQPPENLIPIPETCPQAPISPYGRSKLHVEQMLMDFAQSVQSGRGLRAGKEGPGWFGFAALRYFNVAGCDRSGLLGEHHEPETHLIPVILRAALGLEDAVRIFGTAYATPDGTCIRDYIHVEDLVDAHIAVLGALAPGEARTYNLGIGRGHSVREVIAAAGRVTGRDIPLIEGPPRAGDPARLFADPSKIERELGWRASITSLDEIIASAWTWFSAHPRGYEPVG